jgi:hypothetical protein
MKQYRGVGFDAKDERLYEVAVEAPNQAIACMRFLGRCAETSPLRRLLIVLISSSPGAGLGDGGARLSDR